MKILIAYGKNTNRNPFVRTLADGISRQGIEVVCSVSDFWDNWKQFDIIHLQWPHKYVEKLDTIEHLSSHLAEIRKFGIPLVTTCHNFRPHHAKNKLVGKSYEIVYNYSDCIIHFGSYSFNVFKQYYPEKKHVIIPHHIYNELYDKIPSREEAIEYLKLEKSKRYVLCFGSFRNREEREIANTVAIKMAHEGIKVIAPGFSRVKLCKNLWTLLKNISLYIIRKIKYNKIHFSTDFVSEEELPYYYAASDIALIQRINILNSGNLPMAFMMGKVVVGPNAGNVGAILNETGNPTFDVNNLGTLLYAIESAFRLKKEGKGEDNKIFAYSFYETNIVAQQHCQLYKELLITSSIRNE